MTQSQRFWRVKVPLALPVIVAGVRSAAVEVIASATLAAFVGAGGLGDFITAGITVMDERITLAGAITVILIALLTELALGRLEIRLTPPAAAQT
jgi:osmoprotectant transport system permease protein